MLFVLLLCGCGNLTPVDKPNHATNDAKEHVSYSRSLLTDDQLKEFQECSEDAECVYVDNGCCDCANGGKEAAVNVTKVADFKKALDCSDARCTELARIPECGTGQIKCNEGLCTFASCGDIKQDLELQYSSLINQHGTCATNDDCQLFFGHCASGVGSCYYAAQKEFDESKLTPIVNKWKETTCPKQVCDCGPKPQVICEENMCVLSRK